MFGVRERRRAVNASRARPTIERSTLTARAVCLIIVLALSMITTAAPPNAEAASYTVWACANGSGAPLSVGSWVRAMDAGLADVQATCAEPSAPVGAFLARARAASGDRPANAGWVVAATQGTRITSLDVVELAGAPLVSARGDPCLCTGKRVPRPDRRNRPVRRHGAMLQRQCVRRSEDRACTCRIRRDHDKQSERRVLSA